MSLTGSAWAIVGDSQTLQMGLLQWLRAWSQASACGQVLTPFLRNAVSSERLLYCSMLWFSHLWSRIIVTPTSRGGCKDYKAGNLFPLSEHICLLNKSQQPLFPSFLLSYLGWLGSLAQGLECSRSEKAAAVGLILESCTCLAIDVGTPPAGVVSWSISMQFPHVVGACLQHGGWVPRSASQREKETTKAVMTLGHT